MHPYGASLTARTRNTEEFCLLVQTYVTARNVLRHVWSRVSKELARHRLKYEAERGSSFAEKYGDSYCGDGSDSAAALGELGGYKILTLARLDFFFARYQRP